MATRSMYLWFGYSMTLLSALFNQLFHALLLPFDCTNHENGVWTLDFDPAVKCYEDNQFSVIVALLLCISVPLLLIYVVSITILLWNSLHKRSADVLDITSDYSSSD